MRTTKRIAGLLALPLLLALAMLAALAAPAGVMLGTATLTAFKLTGSANWQYDLAATGLPSPSTNQNGFSFGLSTTNGTGAAGTADLIYFSQLTIAASSSTSLDLSGSLTDVFGSTISMARLKVLYISHLTTTTASSITVGNATNPVNLFSAATTTISIRNGGLMAYGDTGATGVAITGGSSDQLKIANADGSATATVALVAVGSSA